MHLEVCNAADSPMDVPGLQSAITHTEVQRPQRTHACGHLKDEAMSMGLHGAH